MRNQLLRVADWAGMAHSLEIRVPLVDIVLLRQVAPLLVTRLRPTKLDMAGTLVTPLPAEVLNRSKSGFLVPVQRWLAAASGQGRRRIRLADVAKAVYQHHTAL
jgi:asparagine synthase (glutamine-hydrolysing)